VKNLIYQGFDYISIIVWTGVIFVILILLGFALSGLKVAMEYERLVIFRLGKYKRTIGPGVVWVMPWFEKSMKLDMRILTQEIPPQQIMTRDNIPVSVESVVYFKVEHPEHAIIKIRNYLNAVRQLTQASLRDVIGGMELDHVLTKRDKIASDIRDIVDKETEEWGIDIKTIKIQEIGLPSDMKRAMAAQAEAEREKRAAIIGAQGELEAAKNIAEAAALMAEEPAAIHLRTLQTIRDISHDPSQKIIIFMPSSVEEFFKKFR
jgi:regulator of protease activity HflC (stomatin/prohibitin superfamily)